MTNTKKAISIIALVLLVVFGAWSLGTGARKNTVKENKSENKEQKTETLDEKDKDNSETKIAEDKTKDDKTEDENAKNTDEEETATVSENITDDKTEKVDEKVESKVDEKTDTKASETQTTQSPKSETKTTTSNTTSTPKSSSTSTTNASSTKTETKVDTPTSTKPSTQTKKTPVVTTKNVTETLPFSIVRKHNIAGAKTRISQQGKKGSVTYKVTYTDSVQNKKEEISRVNPQNEIIQTYVKVQDRIVEKREVDDLTKPVYGYRNPKDRWFVRNQETGEVKLFYSYEEMIAEVKASTYLHNWGDYEPEWEEYLIGYEPKIVEVVTQEEKWDWR